MTTTIGDYTFRVHRGDGFVIYVCYQTDPTTVAITTLYVSGAIIRTGGIQ